MEKDCSGGWNEEVNLLFADGSKMKLAAGPDTNKFSRQNIEVCAVFPAPLVGMEFCGATKYLPLVKLFIFTQERPIPNANFHVMNWEIRDDDVPHIIFERPIAPENDGFYITAKDARYSFWASLEPSQNEASRKEGLRFGFRS